ncbi:MAG: hypothetical protein LBN05_09055, partial [Oscillospiraceae bacterium]|nr:hypothetical protein [Oscillospiraceae bacterium]
MAKYKVPITTYAAFRAATIGKCYNTDDSYGYQCYDGADLLWQQLKRSLSTGGTGKARYAWQDAKARAKNAGNDFEL